MSSEATEEARRELNCTAMATTLGFRDDIDEPESKRYGFRRGKEQWLIGSVSVPLVGQAEDGDDEATARFRNGRSEEELGVGVLLLPGRGLAVEEDDAVLVVTPMCSDEPAVLHGAQATAFPPFCSR